MDAMFTKMSIVNITIFLFIIFFPFWHYNISFVNIACDLKIAAW